jgi:ankyrin repeat protein
MPPEMKRHDLSRSDDAGNLQLCVAAQQDDGAAVTRLLLDGGADPSLAGGDGLTPLMNAAQTGHLEVLRLLLARGVAVDAVDSCAGGTAFHQACYNNQPRECAEALARSGCDVVVKDNDGLTGREVAEQRGNGLVVARLRALEAERPPVGAVAVVRGLVGAAEHNGQRAAVRRHLPTKGRFELELLASGQKISVKPANFELLIVLVGLAVEVRGLVGTAEHNGKRGVVESRVGENGRCGVRLPGRAPPLGLKPANLQLANQAVALEPEPAGGDAAGGGALWRQLYVAAQAGDGAAVARLLAAGADPNAPVAVQLPSGEVVQRTALCVAVARGRLEVVRLLLEAGADPSFAASDGETPLIIALGVHGQLEVLRLLLERGAAVDAVKPATGGTAFHSACNSNQPDCVEALVRAGCDVGIKDQRGETGLEIAAQRGHAAVVARLRAVVSQREPHLRAVVSEQLRAAQAAVRAAPEPELAAAVEPAGAGALAWQLCEAAEQGDAAAVVRLLAAGVDPNAEEWRNRGWTAFHLACDGNQPDCVEALARAGCDVGLKEQDGRTGRELAEANGHVAVVARLRAAAGGAGGGTCCTGAGASGSG